MSSKLFAVIPAAGIGSRFKGDKPKQYNELLGSTVLERSVKPFLESTQIEKVIVAIGQEDRWWGALPTAVNSKVITTAGGASRAESVLNGLNALTEIAGEDDWVLVHDAVRPCVPQPDIESLIAKCLEQRCGGLLSGRIAETVKRVDESGRVTGTIDRDALRTAQTPQMFPIGVLRKALQTALAEGLHTTDEAMAVELSGHPVLTVEGSSSNIKITYPEDLHRVRQILGANES